MTRATLLGLLSELALLINIDSVEATLKLIYVKPIMVFDLIIGVQVINFESFE